MKKTWFITGVNSGFGRHLTEQLLARGDRVAGTARDLASMAEFEARYGSALWLSKLELTDAAAIRQVVDLAFGEMGRIDVIVSNAGYGLFGAAEEMTDEQIRHQIDTNLIGSIQTVRAALPHLRDQGGGRIIQLSTMGGQAAFPGGSLYHASKWGIEGFIDAVGQEVACFDIACTLIEPGGAGTNFRYQSAKLSPKLAAYDVSPARMAHRIVEEQSSVPPGDASKMAEIIIASADQYPAPKRIALGSDAYTVMHKQLSDRLAALEAQRDLAYSTDLKKII